MFELFTDSARRVVVLAQEEARETADDDIGTEHLLLGLCQTPDTRGYALLAERGVDLTVVRTDLQASSTPTDLPDRDALASLGIDLDEVRGRVEEAFGPGALDNTRSADRARWARRGARRWGHIPFQAGAKKSLELALREAVRLGDRHLGTEHVLLGVLRPGTGRAQTLLEARGITLAQVRTALGEPGAASG